MRLRRIDAFVLVGALGAAIALALSHATVADYHTDGGPSIGLLLRGHLLDFMSHQAAMGVFSILLRWPAAVVARALGSGEPGIYAAGVAVCLVGPAAVGAIVAWRARRAGAPLLLGAFVVAFYVANPMSLHALEYGHPEEVLAGAMCVGAVLLAPRHGLAAGALLGLAVATKQWALVAIGPVLLAAPSRRVALLGVAGAIAAALALPALLADGRGFIAVTRTEAFTGAGLNGSANVYWPFASLATAHVFDGVSIVTVQRAFIPPAVAAAAHPAIVLLGLPLTLLAWKRGRAAAGRDALGLLALLLLARCALDPIDFGYYHAPLLLALITWEIAGRRGFPLVSVLAAAVLWLINYRLRLQSADLTNVVYLVWAGSLAAVLSRSLFWRGRTRPAGLTSAQPSSARLRTLSASR